MAAGRTRVLEGGAVFEKAGVNVSSVWGELEEQFARKLQGEGRRFFAAGLSLILHPRNPRVPTVHANWRFIQQGGKAWFGGGADLTPHYLYEEDAAHFHRVLREVCERHEPGSYARYKVDCDRYFWIAHRDEARGVGGIFFENTGRPLEQEFAFVQDCGRAFLPAYLPIVQRRRDAAVLGRAPALAAASARALRRVQPRLRPGHGLRPPDPGADREHPGLDAPRGGLGLRRATRAGERGGEAGRRPPRPARLGVRAETHHQAC